MEECCVVSIDNLIARKKRYLDTLLINWNEVIGFVVHWSLWYLLECTGNEPSPEVGSSFMLKKMKVCSFTAGTEMLEMESHADILKRDCGTVSNRKRLARLLWTGWLRFQCWTKSCEFFSKTCVWKKRGFTELALSMIALLDSSFHPTKRAAENYSMSAHRNLPRRRIHSSCSRTLSMSMNPIKYLRGRSNLWETWSVFLYSDSHQPSSRAVHYIHVKSTSTKDPHLPSQALMATSASEQEFCLIVFNQAGVRSSHISQGSVSGMDTADGDAYRTGNSRTFDRECRPCTASIEYVRSHHLAILCN